MNARCRMSNRVMTRGRPIVVWVLAFGASWGACGGSNKSLPASGGTSGGGAGRGGTSTGGRGAGIGGQASGGTPDAGAQGDDASAAGGAGGGGGNSAQAGSRGMGGSGGAAGGAGGAAKANEPYFGAGTRLKPRGFRAGDLKILEGTAEQSWVDAETGMACTFRVGSDGVERCLPAEGAVAYADARCTTPVLVGPAPGGLEPPPLYVASGAVSNCNARVYGVGAAPLSNGRTLYSNEDGSCAKGSDPPEAGKAVYPLTEVPLGRFVAVKRVSRPRAPHMDALVREGDDGSYEVVGMIDPVRRVPCFPLGMDISPPVCVPRWQEMGNTFNGSDCTASVAFDRPLFPSCAGGGTALLLKFQRDDVSCSYRSIAGIWETAGTARAQVFQSENGSCVSKSAEPVAVLLPGAAVDVSSLPKFQTIDVGDGPLKATFYGFEGVPFFPAPTTVYARGMGSLTDVARGERCGPHPFADGVWRCVPGSFAMAMDFQVRFASSGCTGPRILEAILSSPSCAGNTRAPRGLIVRTGTNTVDMYPRVVDTFGVTGTISPTQIFTAPGCTAEAAPSGVTFYKADEVLNPAEIFVPLERLRD